MNSDGTEAASDSEADETRSDSTEKAANTRRDQENHVQEEDLMEHVISVRLPSEWRGRIDSANLHDWVYDYLSQPVPLDGEPGSG